MMIAMLIINVLFSPYQGRWRHELDNKIDCLGLLCSSGLSLPRSTWFNAPPKEGGGGRRAAAGGRKRRPKNTTDDWSAVKKLTDIVKHAQLIGINKATHTRTKHTQANRTHFHNHSLSTSASRDSRRFAARLAKRAATSAAFSFASFPASRRAAGLSALRCTEYTTVM